MALNLNILCNIQKTGLFSQYRRLLLKNNFSTSSIIYSNQSEDDKSDSNVGKPTKQQQASEKLQNLLKQIVSETKERKITGSVKLSKPVKKVVESRPSYKVKLKEIKDPNTVKLVAAVKDVADDLGGDVKQTESELLNKLLHNKSGDENYKNLSDLVSGMNVDKNQVRIEDNKAERVRRALAQRSRSNVDENTFHRKGRKYVPGEQEDTTTYKRVEKRVKLFSSEPLNIFPRDGTLRETPALTTWAKLEQKELKLLVTHPPQNIWDEMIQWTNQGKLWHFPINNEQGMDHEFNTDFTQHVFLEEHLEGWCPSRGPIRHFMELVCVGLSKNPYITAEAKRDHIIWFKNYFEQKKDLLKEVGALDVENPPESKQITQE